MSDKAGRVDARGYGITDWMQASERELIDWVKAVEAELDQLTRRMGFPGAGLGMISLPEAAPVAGMALPFPFDTGRLAPSIKTDRINKPLSPGKEQERHSPPASPLDALEL